MNLSKYRRPIQFAFSGLVFYVISVFSNGLAIVFGVSIVLGAVFGKMFCKWMCPMGLFMEFMTRNMTEDQSKAHMYNYYKLGCPISWVQGFLNKYSLFKIKRNEATCTSCGLCDKACYISSLNTSKSLYKKNKETPAEAFSCSKCLKCIDVCPKNSLELKM
jgi:polyferredoxin